MHQLFLINKIRLTASFSHPLFQGVDGPNRDTIKDSHMSGIANCRVLIFFQVTPVGKAAVRRGSVNSLRLVPDEKFFSQIVIGGNSGNTFRTDVVVNKGNQNDYSNRAKFLLV